MHQLWTSLCVLGSGKTWRLQKAGPWGTEARGLLAGLWGLALGSRASSGRAHWLQLHGHGGASNRTLLPDSGSAAHLRLPAEGEAQLPSARLSCHRPASEGLSLGCLAHSGASPRVHCHGLVGGKDGAGLRQLPLPPPPGAGGLCWGDSPPGLCTSRRDEVARGRKVAKVALWPSPSTPRHKPVSRPLQAGPQRPRSPRATARVPRGEQRESLTSETPESSTVRKRDWR